MSQGLKDQEVRKRRSEILILMSIIFCCRETSTIYAPAQKEWLWLLIAEKFMPQRSLLLEEAITRCHDCHAGVSWSLPLIWYHQSQEKTVYNG